jgi:hypothetical protein
MYPNYLQHRATRRERRSKLSKLKRRTYFTGYRWEMCTICRNEYENGHELYIFPCTHGWFLNYDITYSFITNRYDFF